MTRLTPARFAGLAITCVLIAGGALAMLTLKDPEPAKMAPAPEAVPAAPEAEAPAAAGLATRSLTIVPKAPGMRGSESKPMAQSFSAYCQTPQGVCVLQSAQPIGSTCTCPDGTGGRVIP